MTKPIEVRAIFGGDQTAAVNEIFVTATQVVERDATLLTIETSKASVDIFAPCAGRVSQVLVAQNATVREGDLLLLLEPTDSEQPEIPLKKAPEVAPSVTPEFHASPWIRVLARERGLDLSQVHGTGRHGRIVLDDLAEPRRVSPELPPSGSLSTSPVAVEALAANGPTTIRSLSPLQRIVAGHVSKCWTQIPHVTQFDETDITELEAFRLAINQEGPKLSLLAFVIKASACALSAFPDFNSSLSGDELILKSSIHIGFAVDTSHGLKVPVIQHADRLTLRQIASEIARLTERTRAAQLTPAEVRGASFTISNLGAAGGTAFTPIVNAPEVAIVGVSKAELKPKWNGSAFVPRLMLPLSLSYDHRVINGVAGARFVSHLGSVLCDLRRALL